MNPNFQVFFNDNTIFVGEVFKGEWNTVPGKPIEKLIYNIGNKKFFFEGFSEYNHIILESTKFSRDQNPVHRKGHILVMGRGNDVTQIIHLDLIRQKVKRTELPVYEEHRIVEELGWKNHLILLGWYKGILLENPKILTNKAA